MSESEPEKAPEAIDTTPATQPQPTQQEQSPDWAADVPAPVPPEQQPIPPAGEELEPYEAMLKREYDHAIELEISKGMQKVNERFARLLSQENKPTDVAIDALGNSSDYYERIVRSVQSDNWQWFADTREGVYQKLYDLDFTEMRKLEAIQQEYNQAQTQQQQPQSQEQRGKFVTS